MMNKGGFSFVAMLVINPIVILFYQNCSMLPMSHAEYSATSHTPMRSLASEAKNESFNIKATDCVDSEKKCPKSE
ncbi:MAG: hypothetical protein ACXVCY_09760 [Pseudobdellovibrionaceae bacterium]